MLLALSHTNFFPPLLLHNCMLHRCFGVKPTEWISHSPKKIKEEFTYRTSSAINRNSLNLPICDIPQCYAIKTGSTG